jgi:hypothetical protein
VHGESTADEPCDLIVGHGNDERIEEIEGRIARMEADYDYSQSTQNRIDENRCLKRYLERLRKNVSLCMMGCSSFYNSITEDVGVINVYGLSLSDIDVPYLEQLRRHFPDAIWNFSYYSDKDCNRIHEVAVENLNLNKDEYSKFFFNNLNAERIKAEILNEVSLKSY